MKKNIILYSLTILTSMLVGSVLTYLSMTKKQMDAAFTASNSNTHYIEKQPTQVVDKNLEAKITVDNESGSMTQDSLLIIDKDKLASNEVTLNEYSEEQAKQLVDGMPDYVLEQYIDKFLAKDATDVIQDKRRFAERAIEELYQPNDNQQLIGTAKVNFTYVMSDANADTSRVTKFVKMYAHLDTNGQIPANQHVFVKWVNNQTGQVLLFEKKNISVNNAQNWVSLIPTDGWEVGSYDVRFYQFTSELEPIAQTTYEIYEVIDENTLSN